jgi:hypothetical protein
VAIDRTSKFAYAELHEKAVRQTATNFLKALMVLLAAQSLAGSTICLPAETG